MEGARMTGPEEGGESKCTTELPSAAQVQKYRHDWYQTEAEVRVNILIKKVKEENVHVWFLERSVSINGC